uniref:CDT1 domain-containing protein n=1 Tax=Caenorhabditis tropicalis TaxID=1561998 RepID=A0A1I7T3B9_9PELO
MPSAVFCSLLGGISSVIEIHFSIDVVNVQWTDQWLLSAVDVSVNKKHFCSGIPTVFTPVPSYENCLLEEQCRLRRLREAPSPSETTSELPSFRETRSSLTYQVPKEIESSTVKEHCFPAFNTCDLTRLVLIRAHFMQKLFSSFELGTDKSLLVLLRHVLNGISKEIRNKFSFYVFASPYEVFWKRPRCELMKKPPPTSIFRYLLTPSQINMTLAELFTSEQLEGLETMNIYIFVKNMEDTLTGNEALIGRKNWKFQEIIN